MKNIKNKIRFTDNSALRISTKIIENLHIPYNEESYTNSAKYDSETYLYIGQQKHNNGFLNDDEIEFHLLNYLLSSYLDELFVDSIINKEDRNKYLKSFKNNGKA